MLRQNKFGMLVLRRDIDCKREKSGTIVRTIQTSKVSNSLAGPLIQDLHFFYLVLHFLHKCRWPDYLYPASPASFSQCPSLNSLSFAISSSRRFLSEQLVWDLSFEMIPSNLSLLRARLPISIFDKANNSLFENRLSISRV